jgi:hypothetical protein
MSLTATPVVMTRVTAPRRAARKTVTTTATAAAGSSNSVRSTAVAGAVALVISAQPALAAADMAGIFAVPAPNEVRARVCPHLHVPPEQGSRRLAKPDTTKWEEVHCGQQTQPKNLPRTLHVSSAVLR